MDRINQELLWKQVTTPTRNWSFRCNVSDEFSYPAQPEDVGKPAKPSAGGSGPARSRPVAKQPASLTNDDL